MTKGTDPTWDRWPEVDHLFNAALDQDPSERLSYLETSCPDDQELIDAVLKLLQAEQDSQEVFATPGVVAPKDFLDNLASRSESERQIGRYTVIRELGRGGMGTVYLGEYEGDDFKQKVALKVLRRGVDTEDILRRFSNERRILATLSHPNIARLYDGGATDDGQPYLVMEFIDGESITTYCDRKRLTVRERLDLVLDVAAAVQAAHTNLIVHRDLKPSNILVTAEGHVKLLDFGIAKLLDPDEASAHTRTGSYLLTPDHASPEQLRGEPVTTATDVFQLGVLTFQLLTGQRPYRADSGSAAALKQLADRLETPRASAVVIDSEKRDENTQARSTNPAQLSRMLKGDLDTIVGKALNSEPGRRYSSVENFAEDIRRYLGGRTITAQPDTIGYRARKFLSRNPWVAPVIAVAIAAVGIYIATLVRHTHRLEAERNTARIEADRAQEVQRFMVDLFSSADPYLPADKELGREITVIEALDLGAERVQTSLQDRPAVRASILAAIADVYQDLNKVDRSLPLQEEALALQQSMHGSDSRQARDSMGMLARLQDMRGEYEIAGELHQRRLDLAQAADPADDAEIIDAHIRIGRHYLATTRYAEAEPHFQAGVDLAAARDLPWEYVDALRSLADTQRVLGKLEEAEATARIMVPQVIEVRGDGTPAAAYARGTLAHALAVQGKVEEAEVYYEQAIEGLKATLGPEHGDTLATINNLAMMRLRAGDPAGAAELFSRIIDVGEGVMGEGHPKVGRYLQNYGTALSRLGRTDEALVAHERAAVICRETLAMNNSERAQPLLSLSSLYLGQGRATDAEVFSQEALDILAVARPDGGHLTAVAQCLLARSLAAQGRLEEAAPHFERSIDPLLDTDQVPVYRAECLTAAAEFYVKSGDAEQARELRAALGSTDASQG